MFATCRIGTTVPDQEDFFYGSGSSDPYPDNTDKDQDTDPDSDPDFTHLLPTVYKINFLKHHISDKKLSVIQANKCATGDQRQEIYVFKTDNFQFVSMIF